MSPNRKADLQRRLAMAPVARPPAGLAERIKSEIPDDLKWDAERERRRFSQSLTFNLRVAASILLLIGSAYLALHVLSRYDAARSVSVPLRAATKKSAAPIVAPAPRLTPREERIAAAEDRTSAPVAPPAAETRRADEAPAAPQPQATSTFAYAPQIDQPRQQVAEQAAPPPPIPTVAPVAPERASAAAPQMAEAAPSAAARKSAGVANAIGGVVPEARAADLALAPPTMFGVTLKSAVQQFAAPASVPERVRLDVEAATIDERPTLRISIDTPDEAHPAGGSHPPAAADARLDIAFNPDAVASQRPLVGPIASSATALPSSESVTALYGLDLKPDIGRKTVIATVVLHYRDIATGKQHVITRTIRHNDVRAWEHASRRTKSVILAEAVTSREMPLDDIIARAKEAGLTDVAAYAAQQKR